MPGSPEIEYLDAAHIGKWPKLVPFNLAFNQIRGISQKEKLTQGGTGFDWSTFCMLYLDPEGTAPYFTMDTFVYTEGGGPEALLRASRNLGSYILHVMGNPNIKAELVDPQQVQKASNRGGVNNFLIDAIVGMYAAAQGNSPLGAMAVQMVTEDRANIAQKQREQQTTWQTMLARDYLSLMDGNVFDGLDKLIESL